MTPSDRDLVWIWLSAIIFDRDSIMLLCTFDSIKIKRTFKSFCGNITYFVRVEIKLIYKQNHRDISVINYSSPQYSNEIKCQLIQCYF